MPARFRLETAPASGPPYFELLAADGTTRWTSKDKLFRVTDTLTGTIHFDARTTPVYATTSYSIGSCNANATFVHGFMKLDSINLQVGQLSPFPAVGDWYYTAGTYVGFCSNSADDLCAYTWLAAGGGVTLEEQMAIYQIRNDVGQTFQFPEFTLAYELWVGTFV